jgi:hypothetical protein
MPVKAAPDMSKFLLSPMPGLLTQVAVKVGQEVKAGEILAKIEAMKMENVLKAERDCVVEKLLANRAKAWRWIRPSSPSSKKVGAGGTAPVPSRRRQTGDRDVRFPFTMWQFSTRCLSLVRRTFCSLCLPMLPRSPPGSSRPC